MVNSAAQNGAAEQNRDGRDQQDSAGAKVHPSTSASSSSVWSSDSDRHNSTGISTLKTITSLSELLQNDAKLSRRPMRSAPIAVPG